MRMREVSEGSPRKPKAVARSGQSGKVAFPAVNVGLSFSEEVIGVPLELSA